MSEQPSTSGSNDLSKTEGSFLGSSGEPIEISSNESSADFKASEPSNIHRQQWEIIRSHRNLIADEIETVSRGLAQSGGMFLKLAKWYRSSATYEEALPRPDVLSTSLPLLKNIKGDKTTFSSGEIRQAVYIGIHEYLSHPTSTGWRIFGSLLYPLIMLLAAWVVWFIASVWYIPQIKAIFDEFGIDLPVATRLVFYSGNVLSDFRYSMPLVVVSFCVLFFLLNRMGGHRFGSDTSWIDQKLMRSRTALANWARHVAMLLEWGIPSRTAILCAGLASQKGWLQRRSIEWISEPSKNSTDVLESDSTKEYYSGKPTPDPADSLPRNFLPEARFQLLNYAVGLPDSPVRIHLLREAANYYCGQSRASLDWIGKFFSVLITWLILGLIVLIVISIYSPVIQLISGLTGGAPGGGGGGWWPW